MGQFRQVMTKWDNEGNIYTVSTLTNELYPEEVTNFVVNDMSCSTEQNVCIVTSSASFFKVSFVDGANTIE
jgi:transposase